MERYSIGTMFFELARIGYKKGYVVLSLNAFADEMYFYEDTMNNIIIIAFTWSINVPTL